MVSTSAAKLEAQGVTDTKFAPEPQPPSLVNSSGGLIMFSGGVGFVTHRVPCEVSCYSDQHVYQVKLFRAKAVELGISFLSMTIFTRFIGDSLSTGRTQSTWPLVGQFTSCTLKDLVEPKVDRWFLVQSDSKAFSTAAEGEGTQRTGEKVTTTTTTPPKGTAESVGHLVAWSIPYRDQHQLASTAST
ncbi:unnamed protein product [Schistocephalus solidus]|uniref:Altered inheritance of mitochondria protein 24, mitochondrial n=1 Tax=Schistocephalus solidus TaxID=70667 RepID=A0A183T846_SCHSO|nr:unnamed protein product [Schistocephalus solidus]